MNLNYRPTRQATPLFADLNRMLSSVDSSAASHKWQPVLEVQRTEKGYQLELDVPGVAPDAIDISIENRILTVAGNRASVDEGATVIRSERQSGDFQRQFNLSEDIDPASIAASFSHGVLKLELHRKESEQPRKISVSIEA